MGVGIFSDCIFFLKVTSLPLKENQKLKDSITLNGGKISCVLNDKCTHAVVNNLATLNSTQQKKIEKHLISVVNPDFIWESVQEERLIGVKCPDNDKPIEVTVEKEQDVKKNLFFAKFIDGKQKKALERDLEEDLEFEDNEDADNIPDDTEVAKYCCFQKEEEYAVVELLCFDEQSPFPFRISTVYGLPNTSQKDLTFHLVDTAEKACEKYEHRVNDVKNKGFTQINKIPLQAENLASNALQKVLLGEAINITEMSPEVAGLVESIWVDAVGHLDSILSCPVENISLNDLSKAEGILRQVRNALIKKDKNEDIDQMMQEFYQCIPHKEKIQNNINMKFLTVKQDLCQVIRDMINVYETSLSGYNQTSTAKYQALRCRIEHIDPNSTEFHQVKQGILDHNHSNRQFNILRVFRVGRLSEATNFKSDLGNVKSLLHASSPCNFVGILSRGLMLPKIIVEEFGGERTDIGNLGGGIYFSDSISTSIKYSQPSDITGSRLLVVCNVALGKCTDVFHRDYTITEPPNGFHSVHGVQRKDGVNSDFTDDEYVVYNVNQVQMRYVVQFSTDGDNVDLHKESLFISTDQTPDHCERLSGPSEDVSIEDLPEKNVTKAGLEGSDGQQIPLESIHVKARLKDLAAQVVMFQTFKNNSTFPIEAKYVFPLDSTVAVCGFEAFINGKHIIGEVKEKQQAHREYRTAIREGHGAYLMDQDAPDVFTVSVGNLLPKATVVIKITYVMELKYWLSFVNFIIPGNVAQWQQDKALKENTQDSVTKVGIENNMAPEGSFCLDMSVEMPYKIESIQCFTHQIKIKKTECKAVIQTEESSSFSDDGFSVVIDMGNIYIPRMWVEKHPDQDSEACMLIFQPEHTKTCEDVILTICLDCSNSMESCFHSAKQVALLALSSIYYDYVNVVLFGSNYKELYFGPKSRNFDVSDIELFIKEAKPTMGSTEFWKVLQSLCLLRPKQGCHKVLLISDGHVQNENLVFQILNKNGNRIRLFPCGVGNTVNKHMLRCFAQYGSGAFEYFADKSKSRWRDQMEKQNDRLRSPACTAISVKWRQYNENSSAVLQAPSNIHSICGEDSLFVYGFVPHCTQATLKAFFNNEEFENMVSTTEQQKTTGTILHTLTARALIKDYEDGILHEKENENEMKKQEMKSFIIQLSKEYSIVTQFTSFVAVEKRSAEEDIDIEPNVLERISAEDVDILPYMDWSSEDNQQESDSQCDEDGSNGERSPLRELQVYLDGLTFFRESDENMDTTTNDMGVVYDGVEESFEGYSSRMRSSPGLPKERESSSLFGSEIVPYLGRTMSGLVQYKSSSSMEGFGLARRDSAMHSLQSSEPAIVLSEPLAAQSSSDTHRLPVLQKEISNSLFDLEMNRPQMQMVGGYSSLESVGLACKESGVISHQSFEAAVACSAPAMAQSSSDMYRLHGSHREISEMNRPQLQMRAGSSCFKGFGLAQTESAMPYLASRPMKLSVPTCGFSSLGGFAQKESAMISRPSVDTAAVFSESAMARTSSETEFSSSLFGSAISIPPEPPLCLFGDAMLDKSTESVVLHRRKKKCKASMVTLSNAPPCLSESFLKKREKLVPPSWPSLSFLQSEEGYWLLNLELGSLLKINVSFLTEDFLVKKGITSLGARGIDTIHKLIATLLVLQIIRTHNILSEIECKTLMKLDQSVPTSSLHPSIAKAIEWAVKSDRQYPGICMRLGLGKDWDQATRQLLGLDPIPTTSDLYSVFQSLFLS